MDVLVIIGDEPVPARIAARAMHELRIPTGGPAGHPDLIGELRGRIPRDIGVIGPADTAADLAGELHRAGLPVTLYTDVQSAPPPAGVRVLPVSDHGPAMEVAESLLDLVGDTPLVRLDRVGGTCPATCWPSWRS